MGNFYDRAFLSALKRIDYPDKSEFNHKIEPNGEFLRIRTGKLVNNHDLHYSEAMSSEKIPVLHVHHIPFRDIPANAMEAEEFFVRFLFRIYMEFHTHELMEGFSVDNKRFRNPHSQGVYQGARISGKALGSPKLWRNHVMWEACAIIARETPPDYRGWLDRLVDWDLEVEEEIKRRMTMAGFHWDNIRMIAPLKLRDESFSAAFRYSLAVMQNIVSYLILGYGLE